MKRRCISVIFIALFCWCFLLLQQQLLLQTSRKKIIRDLKSREKLICGPNGCGQVRLSYHEINKQQKPKSRIADKLFLREQQFVESGEKQMFIIPIMYYNMGPNNLYRIMKESVSLATLFGRTLVIPPFPHHPRMETINKIYSENEEDLMDVDIFDQSYRSIVETDANKILDVKKLKELLPISTYKKFKEVCKGRLQTTLTCGKISGKRIEGLKLFKHSTSIETGNLYEIRQISDEDLVSAYSLNMLNAVKSTENQQCVALALGNKCFGSRQAWLNFWKPKSQYYQRPVVVQKLAKEFLRKKFNDEEFLSVHWRFENVDWLDMCKSSRPSSVRKINRPICEIVQQISYNRTFLDEISLKIENYMFENNLRFLYFAAPPQLNSALEHLQTKLSTMFYSEDVKSFAASLNNNWKSGVFSDNFAASYLDQELCVRSKIFLGSPLSSWTQTVMLDRVSQGLFDYHSIFDIILEDSSSFPKLSWYFPEGV